MFSSLLALDGYVTQTGYTNMDWTADSDRGPLWLLRAPRCVSRSHTLTLCFCISHRGRTQTTTTQPRPASDDLARRTSICRLATYRRLDGPREYGLACSPTLPHEAGRRDSQKRPSSTIGLPRESSHCKGSLVSSTSTKHAPLTHLARTRLPRRPCPSFLSTRATLLAGRRSVASRLTGA